MGEYADMCFEESLSCYEHDMNDPDFVDYDDFLSPRRNRAKLKETKWCDYKIHKVLRETDLGLLVLFERQDNGEPWGYAFWWPKSQVILHEDNTISVPDWLLTKKFDEGGIKQPPQATED